LWWLPETKTEDIMPENQISRKYRYIEIIQAIKIKKIIADM